MTAVSARIRPCVRSRGAGRECVRNAARTRRAPFTGRLRGGANRDPRRNPAKRLQWGKNAQKGPPQSRPLALWGEEEQRSGGEDCPPSAGDPSRSVFCSDDGASIASGYTPSALAGALPRPPYPLKGEKGT